jgi:hypothetical protein
MEFTSVVLYEKQLVYYNVFSKDGWTYTARLLQCSDALSSWPPLEVQLYKEGVCWRGNAEDSLVRCLGFDIDRQFSLKADSVLWLNLAKSEWSYQ